VNESEGWPGVQRWKDLVSGDENDLLNAGSFGGRVGLGERPALLIIDAQNYMVGPSAGFAEEYPSACGSTAEQALERLVPLLRHARTANIPIIYTTLVYRRDGLDLGVYTKKRGLLTVEGWCLEGSHGAEISPLVAPAAHDIILEKKKFSAFHGTPLLGTLIDRRIDTVIVAGGSTSNCVRATVVDCASHNFRTIVVEDCVFDRFHMSHRVALFDMDRQYADVMPCDSVIDALTSSAV